ncbi:MAG: LysM peptidoglycan-binding domain-containing protein [Ruminiclostridium sp.]
MPPSPVKTFPYTIRSGDTLWLIARRYHTTIYAIASTNPGLDLNKLYIGQVIYIHPENGYSPPSHIPVPMRISNVEADLKNHLRMLWEQHVVWTRLVILSMVFSLPDVAMVTNRLLQNPKDFEATLRPLYGDKIASKFADLFSSHLVIAAQLVEAAKAGDIKAAADAEKNWYANADEIAAFLGEINPYWSERNWRAMLQRHLALTKSEAVEMLTKNYMEGISIFDEIEKQALEMADIMVYGITRQFPNKYRE